MATSSTEAKADHHGQPGLTIIGMLGGPGSGKGTQCQLLSKKFNIVHLSIGDVLRQEMGRPGSPFSDIIRDNMAAGRVGPKEITVAILKDHIFQRVDESGSNVFILDGFPRNTEQCAYFESLIAPISFLVVLDCPSLVLVERLTGAGTGRNNDNRGGRFDDEPEIVQKRIETFQKTTSVVIDAFRRRGPDKVRMVDATQGIDGVRVQIEATMRGVLAGISDSEGRDYGPDSTSLPPQGCRDQDL